MKKIIVALDGSKASLLALDWAREITGSMQDVVFHLVHAYWVPTPMSQSAAFAYQQLREEAHDHAQAVLSQAAERMAGAAIEQHAVEGFPALTVLDVAKKVQADLIAVGRRGLGPLASALLGSVSSGVVHGVHAPVLVVHDKEARAVRRVLVGVDGSDHSARALAFAAEWAPDAEITAMHVMSVAPRVEALFALQGMSVDVAVERTAEELVEQVIQKAGVDPARVRMVGLAGNAAEQLVLEYRHGKYDLAVVGRRGLGTLGELVLGSVSERMVRLAPGPVVVVR